MQNIQDLIDQFCPPVEFKGRGGIDFKFRRMGMEDWAAYKVAHLKARKDRLYANINADIPPEDFNRRIAAKAAVDTEIEYTSTTFSLMDQARLDPQSTIATLAYAMIEPTGTDDEKRLYLKLIGPVDQASIAREIVMAPHAEPPDPSKPASSASGAGGQTGESGQGSTNPNGTDTSVT